MRLLKTVQVVYPEPRVMVMRPTAQAHTHHAPPPLRHTHMGHHTTHDPAAHMAPRTHLWKIVHELSVNEPQPLVTEKLPVINNNKRLIKSSLAEL